DVAVQHGDRAKTLDVFERAAAVLGAPAPFRIDRPERDVGEQDDRRRLRFAAQIVLEPGEVLGAEIAEAASLEGDDVDEADEVHAAGVEGIPALALGAAAVALAIELHLLVEEVMLAGHVVPVELALRDDAIGIVEC